MDEFEERSTNTQKQLENGTDVKPNIYTFQAAQENVTTMDKRFYIVIFLVAFVIFVLIMLPAEYALIFAIFVNILTMLYVNSNRIIQD